MISKATDDVLRDLTDHALHNREDDLARTIAEAGQDAYGSAVTVAIHACAYVCIDAADRWPTGADLEKTARLASESKARVPVSADEIHSFLSGVVFGNSEFTGHPLTPLYTLAALLISFAPDGSDQWDYLDVIESAIEAADQARPTDLPAMAYRYLKK